MEEGKEKKLKEKKNENRKEARRKGRNKDRKVGKKASRKRKILKGIKEVIGTGTTGREYRIWVGKQGGMQV